MKTQTNLGVTIQVFIPGGSPDGIWQVSREPDWKGLLVVCPRALYPTVRAENEFTRPGVYVLWGEQPDHREPTIYVGEGDPVQKRIDTHFKNKDFWDCVYVCVSDNDSGKLNKAHIQHLESRLYGLAKEVNKCMLDSKYFPQLPTLSEPEAATVENYLSNLLSVLGVLGVKVFRKPQALEESAPKGTSGVLHAGAGTKGVRATGYLTSSGFVVLAGSEAALNCVPKASKNIIAMIEGLKAKGVLISKNDQLVFTQDYEFGSPSGAAAAMLGRSADGRLEWKDEQGKSLKELQSASISPEAQELRSLA